MKESCIFCNFANQGVSKGPAFWENDTHIAFLDIHPSRHGHTLVIPKNHSESHMQLPAEEYTSLWQSVRKVAHILDSVLKPKVVSVVVEGLEVAHTHVHLIPLSEGEKLAEFDHINQGEEERIALMQQLINHTKNNA
jgi:histidine triad (HIT) family protein